MSEQAKTRVVSRRHFLRMAGIAGGASILAACAAPNAAPDSGEEPQGDSAQPAGSEPITLSWWNQFSTPMCQDLFPKIVQQFVDQHPNITVEFEITGGPPGG